MYLFIYLIDSIEPRSHDSLMQLVHIYMKIYSEFNFQYDIYYREKFL